MRVYPEVTQLLIVLEPDDFSVWRRVQVSSFTKLGGLHRVIAAAMGWDDTYPHRFILAGDVYQRVAPGEALDPARERNWRLDSALYPDKAFVYECGAHFQWRNRVVFEEYAERIERWRYPRCVSARGSIDGQRKEVSLNAINRRIWLATRP